MRTIIIIIFTVMMAGTCKAQTFDFSCTPNVELATGNYLSEAFENDCGVQSPSLLFNIFENEIISVDTIIFGVSIDTYVNADYNVKWNFISLIGDVLTVEFNLCTSEYIITKQ